MRKNRKSETRSPAAILKQKALAAIQKQKLADQAKLQEQKQKLAIAKAAEERKKKLDADRHAKERRERHLIEKYANALVIASWDGFHAITEYQLESNQVLLLEKNGFNIETHDDDADEANELFRSICETQLQVSRHFELLGLNSDLISEWALSFFVDKKSLTISAPPFPLRRFRVALKSTLTKFSTTKAKLNAEARKALINGDSTSLKPYHEILSKSPRILAQSFNRLRYEPISQIRRSLGLEFAELSWNGDIISDQELEHLIVAISEKHSISFALNANGAKKLIMLEKEIAKIDRKIQEIIEQSSDIEQLVSEFASKLRRYHSLTAEGSKSCLYVKSKRFYALHVIRFGRPKATTLPSVVHSMESSQRLLTKSGQSAIKKLNQHLEKLASIGMTEVRVASIDNDNSIKVDKLPIAIPVSIRQFATVTKAHKFQLKKTAKADIYELSWK
jgi:hypothetical protein